MVIPNPNREPWCVGSHRLFVRFGNFQIFAARGEIDVLQQLVDYTIRTDFPHLGEPSRATYLAWFEEVCRTTAQMIVHWLRVGFVHGVMNTDNMSILGLTIDYGPYGWLENYDSNWTPNTTDAAGHRYAFGKQPQIAHWNLVQLANAIYPLIEQTEPLEKALSNYVQEFESCWQSTMTHKLGLQAFKPDLDDGLIAGLLEILQLAETDMTIFYRRLASLDLDAKPADEINEATFIEPLLDAYYVPEQLTPETTARISAWLRRYHDRVREDGTDNETRRKRMNAVNPKYVLRNYLAQLAIDKAEQGDPSMVHDLLELLRHPTTNNRTMKPTPKNGRTGPASVRAVPCCRAVHDGSGEIQKEKVMAHLTILPATADTADILPIIERDGAIILKDMLTPAEVDRVVDETGPYIEATRNGQDPFVGLRTTRTGALVARSPACRDLVTNQAVLKAAQTFLAPYCSRIQLHLGQIIRIRPGQPKQAIHRDRWAWEPI